MLLWALLCLPLAGWSQIGMAEIQVEVVNLGHDRGQLGILLFDGSEGFPMDPERAVRQEMVLIEEGQARHVFSGLPYGRYAIAVMHDENGNNQLDTNMLGIPKEGNGISNNAKGTFGSPSFDKAAVAVDQPTQTIRIKMRY